MLRTVVVLLAIARAPLARANGIEARSEVEAAREFAWFSTSIDGSLAGGKLGLGAAFLMASDWRRQQYGASALLEYRGDALTLGVEGSWAPTQDRRGWASVDPHASYRFEAGRAAIELSAGILWRRIAAPIGRGQLSIDQLQGRGELALEVDERWEVAAGALGSFYDPDLAQAGLRGLELGPAVSVAGKPEHWAVRAKVARRFAHSIRPTLALDGIAYANRRGGALAPSLAIRAGPYRGISVEAKLEVVTGVAAAAGEVRPIGGLEFAYER
jgi:hypothetical protein